MLGRDLRDPNGVAAAPWGDLRRTASALGIELPQLIREAEAREASP